MQLITYLIQPIRRRNFKISEEENIGGIKVNGMLVQMLCFADDIVVIAEREKYLAYMLEKMNGTIKE